MSKLCFVLLFAFAFIGTLSAQEMGADYDRIIKQHRKEYKKAIAADERSPFTTKKETKAISFFEADKSYVVKSLFIRTAREKPFEMATYSGETKPYIKYGELLFELPGYGTQRISVYQSLKALKVAAFKNHLFIPFKDLTNGELTYGGGRYIDLKISDIQKGIVQLDFNKAYNPWCAYSEGYSCPIPPVENNLNLEIRAGELNFTSSDEMKPKS